MPACRSYPAITLVVIMLVLPAGGAALAQHDGGGRVLKGRAVEEGVKEEGGSGAPSLSRSDIDQFGDPFSGGGPADDIAPVEAPLPPVARTAAARQDEFAGVAHAPAGKADPDTAKPMQLAWDAWHKRVAEAIFQRWNFLAQAAFKDSPPLLVRARYTVTREGRIEDVQFLVRSPNVIYNTIVLQAIQSVSGDKTLLQFPAGSRRAAVEKFADFCQNCGVPGNQVRPVTGDQEVIDRKQSAFSPGQRRHPSRVTGDQEVIERK